MASRLAQPIDATEFQHDKELGIWLHPDHDTFAYSDGDKVERRILQSLRNTCDLSLFSSELAEKITDWPSQYHFSPTRHNLLRHVQFDRGTSVLELGAGCGAITRQLGESAGDVWALEGSRARAACAAARTRDLPNVRLFASDFQLFKTDRRFDVVTLIGVLEYSPVFFKSENPFLECLKLARSLLKPDGVLLLAIENQLGLKYFCGAPEDHTGKPYDGVQDLYRSRGVQTRGRAELTKVLHDAGFPAAQFQYPYPDYKLPSWVLTHRAFETPEFDPAAILRTVQSLHDGKPARFNADERRIRTVLHRNGLLEELANSFLVFASHSDPGAQQRVDALLPANLLATGYTTSRQQAFNTQTRMTVDQAGAITVEKSSLSAATSSSAGDFEHVNTIEPYRSGLQLERVVIDALTRQGFDAALAHLRQWIDFIIDHGIAARDQSDVYASTLKPEFFDCNPRNLIVTPSGFEPIDLEWRYLQPLSLRTAVLLYLKPFSVSEAGLLRNHLKGREPLHLQLARRLGVKFNRQQFRESSHQRRHINRLIAGKQTTLVREPVPSLLRRVRKMLAHASPG
jgi:2-polyprenyl-3-methyl-5-hydroxy-6-metoxy-1,4-benzoquinol methylase